MSRSLKKGPYIYEKLLKKISVLKPMDGTVVKTWARDSQISPEMIGFTFGVHNGKGFHPSENNGRYDRSSAGRVQPDQKIRQAWRQDAERDRNQEKESEIASAQAAKAAPEKK